VAQCGPEACRKKESVVGSTGTLPSFTLRRHSSHFHRCQPRKPHTRRRPAWAAAAGAAPPHPHNCTQHTGAPPALSVGRSAAEGLRPQLQAGSLGGSSEAGQLQSLVPALGRRRRGSGGDHLPQLLQGEGQGAGEARGRGRLQRKIVGHVLERGGGLRQGGERKMASDGAAEWMHEAWAGDAVRGWRLGSTNARAACFWKRRKARAGKESRLSSQLAVPTGQEPECPPPPPPP
jgi:hypothetical protein